MRGRMKRQLVNAPAITERPLIQNDWGCTWGGNAGGFMGTLGGPQGGLPGLPAGFGVPEQLSDSTSLFTNLRWYPISNFRQVLSQTYIEIGLIKTIVDVPVDDALRGGITIKSKQLSEEELADLKVSMKRDGDMHAVTWAAKWNRLFGGAGVMILVDDQDPEEPLDLESIGPNSKVTFRDVDMWELFWSRQNVGDGEGPVLDNDDDYEFYDYYSLKVHKSRVMRLKGMRAPSFVRPRFRGWGVSVVENLVRSINQYLKSSNLTFEVLDEFKIDVYKVKNLVNTLLNPNGQQQIQQRIQLANWQKNYQNAVVMDSEDDWDHKQLTFSGLAEAQAGIRQQVSADMRIPQIKLFGQSFSPGLGDSSQSEMENYNSMVESEIRDKLEFDILRLIEIRCQQKFGYIPDDLEIEFAPLRVLTAEQEENVKEKKFNRIQQAKAAGEITTLEYRDACNKDKLFAVKLDTTEAAISEIEDQQDEMAEQQQPAEGKGGKEKPKGDKAAKGEKPKPVKTQNSKPKIRCWRVAA